MHVQRRNSMLFDAIMDSFDAYLSNYMICMNYMSVELVYVILINDYFM